MKYRIYCENDFKINVIHHQIFPPIDQVSFWLYKGLLVTDLNLKYERWNG